jgi:hypothetical protein
MRPCFMFTVFNIYSEHINRLKSTKATNLPSTRRTDIRQALMDDFSDLLVNIWDTWTDSDIRLTQVHSLVLRGLQSLMYDSITMI